MPMSHEGFNEYESVAIADAISEVTTSAPAQALFETIMRINKEFGKMDLQKIETILRRKDRSYYLAAEPVDPKSDFDAKWIHAETTFPYHLDIIYGTRESVEKVFKTRGTTYEENFRRLAETGVQTVRPGTNTSMRLQARNN